MGSGGVQQPRGESRRRTARRSSRLRTARSGAESRTARSRNEIPLPLRSHQRRQRPRRDDRRRRDLRNRPTLRIRAGMGRGREPDHRHDQRRGQPQGIPGDRPDRIRRRRRLPGKRLRPGPEHPDTTAGLRRRGRNGPAQHRSQRPNSGHPLPLPPTGQQRRPAGGHRLPRLRAELPRARAHLPHLRPRRSSPRQPPLRACLFGGHELSRPGRAPKHPGPGDQLPDPDQGQRTLRGSRHLHLLELFRGSRRGPGDEPVPLPPAPAAGRPRTSRPGAFSRRS